jgi:hypothetical protein
MTKARSGRKAPRQRRSKQTERPDSETSSSEQARLQSVLRGFASNRPQGWSHDDWVTLLAHLTELGHDTAQPDRIGEVLERERLALVLAEIPGMGPRRIELLVSRFGTVWRLSQASVDEVATLPNVPRTLAARTLETIHQRRH